MSTKLRPPRSRPKLVARPRLDARLGWAAGRKLTLASAPAGFGKTTLLAGWLESAANRGKPVAWVSLDAGDNDPARFLSYLVAALKTVEGGIGEGVLALLRSPQPPGMEEMVGTLVNDLASLSGEITVVLDDYHVIDSGSVHGMISFLLDNLPPNAHLVVSSRIDPPLPLPRLRARDQMAELRAADLRFTPEEAGAFLGEVMGLDLTPGDVAALEARTEGWIAGLQLAALSMRGRGDVAGFIEAFTGSNRYVLDYLIDEVLLRQPEDVRSFLLQSSILDRMSGDLCEAVTGEGRGQEMLETLDRENLFTISLDEERRWYRYHHLFAEFLRDRLRRADPNLVPELHRRAAEWHERHGSAIEAMGHALAAEDFERAVRLIEHAGEKMLQQGELSTPLSWLEALPDDLLRSDPRLCLMYARALMAAGRHAAAEASLEEAERGLGRTAEGRPETEEMKGEAAALRAFAAAFSGHLAGAVELAQEALESLPEDSYYLRSSAVLMLGLGHYRNGDLAAASRAFSEAAGLGLRVEGSIAGAVGPTCYLAQLEALRGHLHEAARLCRHALQLGLERNQEALSVMGFARMGLGEVLREWNDMEAAARHLTVGIESCKRGGLAALFPEGCVSLARVRQAQGDATGALSALTEAEELVRGMAGGHAIPVLAAHRARLHLAQGDVAAATGWAREAGVDADDDPSFPREVEHLVLARVLIARHEPDRAQALLQRLLGAAEAGERTGSVIEILALQALALRARGNTTGAMDVLAKALALAEPEGYVRIFVDEGEPMAALLMKILEARKKGRLDTLPRTSREYVGRLLMTIETEASPPTEEGHREAAGVLVEPLSERELEVLRLIASGMANKDVARDLFVAVSTVKTHVNGICRKLDARNRTEAVARARELGLL